MPRASRIGTREEILATALELFLAQGYDATSLREIAERLGMTKAALYYHFPAKEQIAVELSRPVLNAMADLVAKARAERGSERESFRVEVLSDYLDHLVGHHELVEFLSMNPAAQNHPDIGQRGRNLLEALTAELAGPEAGAEDKLRVACAFGAIHALAVTPIADVDKAREVILGAAIAVLDSAPVHRDQQSVGRSSAGAD